MTLPREPRLSRGVLVTLGIIAMVSSISTDMYLPSFTSVAADLSATASEVQLTLTLFFFGVGTGQLLLGPISDRRGRRPVLLLALTVFASAGVAMVFAPTIEALMVLRFVQGLSGAAGLVLSRAIAADLSHGQSAAKALSFIVMISGLGPLIAPLLGGIAHEWWGWRGALATLASVSLMILILAFTVLRESHPPQARTAGSLLSTYRPVARILRDGRFVALAIGFALSFAGAMSYIAAAPFVTQRVLGMSPLGFALSFAVSASAMVLANLVNIRLVSRIRPPRLLAAGIALVLGSGLAFLLQTLIGVLTPAGFIITAFVLTAGSGFVLANASALALDRVPTARGSASALLGAIQFLFGGLAAPVVGLWGESTALPMAIAISVCGAGALMSAIIALRPRSAAAQL